MEFIGSEFEAKLFDDVPIDSELYSSFSSSKELDDLVLLLAKSGRIVYDWRNVKKLLRFRIYNLLEKYFKKCGFVGPITEAYDERRDLVLTLLDQYDDPPFTIQRIAELLVMESYTQYHSTHKLINAFEKLLSVAGGNSPSN